MRGLLLALALLLAQPAYAKAPIVATDIATRSRTIHLKLEIADTPEAREYGLMNRKTLAPHDGMAFFFSRTAPQKFWMKDTIIPLDILFVDEQRTIVYITTGKPLSEEPLGPDTPVSTVIELAGGRAAKDGITVGDKVTYAMDCCPRASAH